MKKGKKGNMKKCFVINIYEKLNLCEYQIYAFLPLQLKAGHWFYISKILILGIQKTGKDCKYFCLLKNSCQSKEFPFLNNSFPR